MKSFILEEGEKGYSYLGRVFAAMEGAQNEYNWLVTEAVCYPCNEEVEWMLLKEYCWLSGEELTKILKEQDFQWVWGVLSAFQKQITLETVLQHPLPYVDGNPNFWVDNVALQHPLAQIEIVAFDSALTLFLSERDDLALKFANAFPLCEDLQEQNRKRSRRNS